MKKSTSYFAFRQSLSAKEKPFSFNFFLMRSR